MAKIVITWLQPDNGPNIYGPVICDIDCSFDEMINDEDVCAQLHTALSDNSLGAVIEAIQNGEYEHDQSGDEGSAQCISIACDYTQLTIVYLPDSILK